MPPGHPPPPGRGRSAPRGFVSLEGKEAGDLSLCAQGPRGRLALPPPRPEATRNPLRAQRELDTGDNFLAQRCSPPQIPALRLGGYLGPRFHQLVTA